MNKRILTSLAIIIGVVGLVAGATWALFSSQGQVKGNTFSTGEASLKIRLVGSGQGWLDEVTGVSWDNLFPGWSETYDVQLQNVSTSEIGFDIIPQVIISSDPNPKLRNVITLQFFDGGSPVGPEWTLNQWSDNEGAIEHIAQGDEGKVWTLKFSFPDNGEDQNDLQNQTIGFDLLFDGVQTEAPVSEVTNVTKESTHGTDIQAAIDSADEGDEILVPEGVYNVGSSTLNVNINGLTLKADNGYLGKPLINGRVAIIADGVTFEDFHVNLDTSVNKAPLDLINANGLTIRNNKVEGGPDGGGISTWTGPAVVHGDVLIENNQVIKGPIGIIPGDEVTNLVIRNNTMVEPADEGIWIWQNSQATITLEENTVVDAGLTDVKIVDEPVSINGETVSNRCQAILEDNPGISSVWFEWSDYTCTQ